MPRLLAALVVAVALCAGCVGGGAPTPTPKATSKWRAGEYRPYRVPDLCAGITRSTLTGLHIRQNVDQGGTQCGWHETDDLGEAHVTSDLSVDYEIEEPGEGTATKAAEHEFAKAGDDLGDDERLAAVTVPGIGDQAKVFERLALDAGGYGRARVARLVVRQGNVVVSVKAATESDVEDGRDAVTGFAEVEAGALTATRQVLGRLTGKPVRAAALKPLGDGEIARVRSVCGTVTSARRLASGAHRVDITAKGATSSGGCNWVKGEYLPTLSVYAEAVAPSRTTRQTASVLAHRFYAAQAFSTKHRLGDEASTKRWDGEVEAKVRRGNLLVYVKYDPDGRASGKRMEDDVLKVARQVLDANR